jgi:hypothetical protein
MRHVQAASWGATYSACAVAQYVCVDHRRCDVAVVPQLLDRSYVVSALEQVRGQGVAKAVTGQRLLLSSAEAPSDRRKTKVR